MSKIQIENDDRNSTALSQYQTQIETAALVSLDVRASASILCSSISFCFPFLLLIYHPFVCCKSTVVFLQQGVLKSLAEMSSP